MTNRAPWHVAYARELKAAARVAGILTVRVRSNTVPTPCDSSACPHGREVARGEPFVRVVYADERGREHFHPDCYRSEFVE